MLEVALAGECLDVALAQLADGGALFGAIESVAHFTSSSLCADFGHVLAVAADGAAAALACGSGLFGGEAVSATVRMGGAASGTGDGSTLFDGQAGKVSGIFGGSVCIAHVTWTPNLGGWFGTSRARPR